MHIVKARKGLSLLTAATIVISTFIAPTSAVAAGVESRGVYIDAAGRAGSKIVVTVMSKLPTGATSTTDVGFAYLYDGPSGTNLYSNNFSYSSAPFKVVNSIAYYKITLNSGPLVGNYNLIAGVASSGTTNYTSATASGNRVSYHSFKVGGTASTVKFSSRQLKISPSATTSISDLSPSGFVLFDATGNRTLLSDTETVQITTVSAPVGGSPAYALGEDTRTATAGSTTLEFSSVHNYGDGIFRFKVGNSAPGTSVVRASLLANSAAVATSNFTLITGNNQVTGRAVQLLNYADYSSGRMYASGTDGKLYSWGSRRTGLVDAITNIDIGLRTDVKPTLIDFPKAVGAQNYNHVEQLIRLRNSAGGIHVLRDDGTLWSNWYYSGLSAEQAISGGLEPVFTPNLDTNFISSVSEDSFLLLLNDGTVLTRVQDDWKFTSFDLSSVGNPEITQVARMSTSQTNILLARNGKVYSSGSNTYGELGQGSDTATTLGEVTLPANRAVSKIYAGTRFGVIKTIDGSYWSWGDNRSGQQGKLASEVPYSNTPRVVISPAGFTINDLRAEAVITLIGSSSVYFASEGYWSQQLTVNAGSTSGEILSGASVATYDEASYSYFRSSLYSTTTGRVYQSNGPTGSCLSSTGRIRSDGQFGDRWFIDPVQSGSKLLIDSTTTTSITGAISVKVNSPFTIQAANVKTNCYPTSELTFAWDKDGDGSYETPDTPTVGDTGYLGLNASFNFSSAGRRNVTLGVTTPDSVTLPIPFIIGVEPETRTTLAALDTSTASLATNFNTTIALTSSGGVHAWGDNSYGQLGVSTFLYSRRNIAMPLTLPDSVTAVSVAVRDNTTLIIDSSGSVWGLGRGIYINNTGNNYATPTRVTLLQSIKVRSIRDNFVLTTDGRLLLWNPNGTTLTAIPSLAGVYITSFTDRRMITGCGAVRTSEKFNMVDAVDSNGNLWSIPYSSSYLPGDAERLSMNNVVAINGSGNRATVRTASGEIYFSNVAGCEYGNVVKPAGTTLVDVAPYSMYSNMIAMTDTSKNVWTNSVSQSAGVFQPGTWTKLSAIDAVRLSSADTPQLMPSAPNYIGFASARIFSTNEGYAENGSCGSGNSRLYSTGQFGNTFFQDSLIISSSTAFVGAGSAVNFTSGQTLAAQSGDNLIFKLSNPRSSCFTGSTQLSAIADLDGNGTYESNLSPTNESGTYAFIATTTAPTSGRKTFSFKLETPIGTSSVFTVSVGVYASTPNANVTVRSKAFNTSYRTSFAVGTDGFGYAWGGGMNFMNILTSTPPRTQLKPTKVVIPGNPQIVDGATYTNYDYDEDYGLLVVDADGKVWSWGTRRNMDSPASTFPIGSVPTTATQISSLSGVVIKRISVDVSGYRALALSDAGNVYQWDDTSRTPTLVSGLAGITIKNIWASGDIYAALSTTGALYTWGGYGYALGRIISTSDCYWCSDSKVGLATITDPVADATIGFSKDISVSTALTATGKLFSWGNFKSSQVFVPEENLLPGSRIPSAIGSSGSAIYVVATDKSWWRQALDVNRNIVYYSVTNVPADVRNTFSGFATGTGSGVATSNSNLYTLNYRNAGTCGPVSASARVMSEGQFGASFADDSIDIEILGNEISRPNTDNFFNVIASSRCFGATGVTITADLTGGGTYSSALGSTVADDGSSVNAKFKFNAAINGALYIPVKATTSASVVSTQTYYTLVVPLPPAGRKIGVSINAGARYTSSSNVVLDLVWPDGVYKIFVSNDGGFAPGTVTEIDLRTQINWVLPPQAVIPLASIVYARFGDSTSYYFDDIIIDSISPVLTFASARP